MVEQSINIKIGQNGKFEKKTIAKLKRHISVNQVVRLMPLPRYKPKPPKEPKLPQVVDILRKVIKWQEMLDKGEIHNRAAIAKMEGITRACVTQTMILLRLVPEIQEYVLSMPKAIRMSVVSLTSLRPIAKIENRDQQIKTFRKLTGLETFPD